MQRNKILTAVTAILLTAGVLLTGCSGGEKLTEIPGNKYETIYAVDGVRFSMYKSFLTSATAVTEVSDNSDFDENGSYIYKDGENQYLFFNMNSVVVAVEKGTTFNFTTTKKKEDALENSSIMKIWLTSTEKKGLNYKESNHEYYKLIADVDAQVAVTTNLFGDFVGELAYVRNEETEWSLFVGVPGTDPKKDITKQQKEYIAAVAKSFCPAEKPDESISYAVVASGSEIPESEMQTETAPAAETVADTETEKKETVIETTEESATNSEPAETVENDKETSAAAPETSEETQAAGTEAEPSGEEETPSEETAPLETVREAESRPVEGETVTIHVSNQKEAVSNRYGIADSSIYSFLKIGQKGSIDVLSDNQAVKETMAMKLHTVYTGSAAIELIKAYCTNGDAGFDYTDPPVGTVWNVAEYDLDYMELTDRPYVDIKILGVDGQKLRHAGIVYSSRTYDMDYKTKDDKNYMIFYAVPSNTTEYVLAGGLGNENPEEKDLKGAFYLIKMK